MEIQLELVRQFPDCFYLELGDGFDGYEGDWLRATASGQEEFALLAKEVDKYKPKPKKQRMARASASSTTSAWFYSDPGSEEEEEPFTPHSGYYCTGNGDSVYMPEGSEQDFAACSSECGYCGRCIY